MPNLISIQVVAYGMSAGQRAQAATTANNWLSNKQYNYRNIVPDFFNSKSGLTYFFMEIDGLVTRLDGDDLFEVMRSWLSTRATDFPDGTHSYVRLAEQVPTENRVMRAESPAWTATSDVQAL